MQGTILCSQESGIFLDMVISLAQPHGIEDLLMHSLFWKTGPTILTTSRTVPGWTVTFTENATDAPRPENGTFDSIMYTNKLLEFFKKTESEKKPFFAYLAFQVAHSPFMSPPELIEKYDKIYSAGWDKIREQRFEKQKELGFWPANMTDPGRIPPNVGWDTLTNDQKAYAAKTMAVHAGGIEQMDMDIGRVIEYLKGTGQYDNTFIMFTSDNGSSEPVEITDFQYASGFNAKLGSAICGWSK